jgi:phosphoribosylanthranilate isomerase
MAKWLVIFKQSYFFFPYLNTMLITKVKAGAVSSLSDARFFAGMGVDWLGFDVNPTSESFVNVDLYKSLVGWVSGPKRVIEIPKALDTDSIAKLISDYLPECIEVELSEIEKFNYDLPIFARAQLEDIHISKITSSIKYLVLETNADLFKYADELKSLATQTSILVSISPNQQDVKKVLNELPIAGIALRGSQEVQTGIKDYDYSELLESLETE